MKVTKIVTNNLTPRDEGVCGEFSIILDNSLCIHKILVVKGKKGLFITFPNTGEMKRFESAKRYVDIVHPISNSLRQYIQSEVLSYYESEIEKLD